MEIWTAFLLGLVGSLHCAGMCGPLALVLPAVGGCRTSYLAGRACYNLGRLAAYGLLGIVFGLLGQALLLAGFQRWLSVGAGTAMLAGLAFSSRFGAWSPVTSAVGHLKSAFASLLRRRSHAALLMLGVLNGFLPCGLVYSAGAASVAAGGPARGVLCMVCFGIGTMPVMFVMSLAGRRLQPFLRVRVQRFAPACAMGLAVLLILRGLGLGIPYVSPDLSSAQQNGHASCH